MNQDRSSNWDCPAPAQSYRPYPKESFVLLKRAPRAPDIALSLARKNIRDGAAKRTR